MVSWDKIKMWLNLNGIDFSIIVALSFWEWFLTMMNCRIIRWCLKIKSMVRCDLQQWIPDVVIKHGHQYFPHIPPAVFNVQSELLAALGNKAINRVENPPCCCWADSPHSRVSPNDWLSKAIDILKEENQDIKGYNPLKGTLENVIPTPCCQPWHILPVETETAFLSFSWKKKKQLGKYPCSL